MDTRWLAAAGVACVLAFAGMLYIATPAVESAPVAGAKSDIKSPTVSRAKSGGAKSKKSGGKAGKSAKGGKGAKGGKTARPAGGGAARTGGAAAARTQDPAAAARKWDEMRAALTDAAGAKLDTYATQKGWDDAKKKSVQTLLDDSLARVDEASAAIQSGTMSPEQARTEFAKLRSDVARQLTELVGAEDAMGLAAELRAGRGGGRPTQP